MLKLRTLQVYRGLAALFVLLAHTAMVDSDLFVVRVWDHGTSGVVFFFILSGFIIYYVNFKRIGTGTSPVLEYLRRRLLRIYPPYWVYTFCLLGISFAFLAVSGKHLIDWNPLTARDMVQSLLLFPYSKTPNEWPIIPAAWTLSYEVLFYIAFVALLLHKRFGYSFFLGWAGLIVIRTMGLIDVEGLVPQFLLNDEILLFMFGMVIAHVFVATSPTRRMALIILAAGTAGLAASWGLAYAGFEFSRVLTFGAAYSALILGAVVLERQGAVELKADNPLVVLGDASYSVYLTHYWVLILVTDALAAIGLASRLPLLVLFIVRATVAVGIGVLAYRIVEVPLMDRLKRPRKRRPAGEPLVTGELAAEPADGV